MTSQTEEPATRLKNSSSTSHSAYFAAGMVTLVCIFLLSIGGANSAIGLFFASIALLALVMAKFSEKLDTLDFAILYSDRIEIPDFRNSRRVVHWNQVSELRWYGTSSSSLRLRIYTTEFKTPLGFFEMNPEDLDLKDRLTFIRYVRQSSTVTDQKNWPTFAGTSQYHYLIALNISATKTSKNAPNR